MIFKLWVKGGTSRLFVKIHYRSIDNNTYTSIHLRHHFSVTRILYYIDACKEATSSFTSIDSNTITTIVRVVGPPLREKESSTAFAKHRQNDISVSLFPGSAILTSRISVPREGGKGVFHQSVGLIAPAVYCVLEQHWKAA